MFSLDIVSNMTPFMTTTDCLALTHTNTKYYGLDTDYACNIGLITPTMIDDVNLVMSHLIYNRQVVINHPKIITTYLYNFDRSARDVNGNVIMAEDGNYVIDARAGATFDAAVNGVINILTDVIIGGHVDDKCRIFDWLFTMSSIEINSHYEIFDALEKIASPFASIIAAVNRFARYRDGLKDGSIDMNTLKSFARNYDSVMMAYLANTPVASTNVDAVIHALGHRDMNNIICVLEQGSSAWLLHLALNDNIYQGAIYEYVAGM